jgi:hypothetical protein
MTQRWIGLLAVAAYLAVTLTVSYAAWGPYDGVEPDPQWARGEGFFVFLLAVHAIAGFAIRRWWALGLPILWALLSVPAGGYDLRVWVGIVFCAPFYWMPAVLVGLVARWVVHLLRLPPPPGVPRPS